MSNRRNTELMLMLAAVPALFILFLTANIQGNQELSFASFAVPLGLLLAFGVAHVVERRFAKNADPALLPIAFLLSGTGICFVQRLAPELALKQTVWLFASVVALILTLILVRSVKSLARYKYTMMLAGIILLLLPALVGVEIYGSKIWLSIGGFSFQPSEIAKILIILFLASYLADNREMLSITRRRTFGISTPDLKTLLPMLVMWLISLLVVVFEHDLGSALFFFGVFMVMLFVATGRWFYVIIGIGLVALGAVGAYLTLDYVKARFDIWLDPFAYADDDGYQLVQALYSLADGGLFGTGIGRGYPTLIPIVESDFIFVAIAEEMGLLGAAAVLILYLLFAVRGFATAARCKSDIDAIAAVGLTTAITLQAFVIVGGTIGVIPLTGVTLPFMSQGGSSLLSSFIILGLLLRSGDDGTGLEEELVGTTNLGGGILGRVSLGKRLTVITVFMCLLFAVLIARLTYVMIIQAEELQTSPNNNHTILRESTMEKGSILTSDGVILAESRENGDGTYDRVYPQGSLAAQVLGYSSQRYGSSGVEASQSDTLTGHKNFATIGDAIRSAAGSEVAGNDVVLTIDSRIQGACEDALAGLTGAAVVLDAETGAVLGMASSPTYDVNQAENLLDAAQDGGGGSALLNRATGALYAPGSTFKVVTLVGALEKGIASPSSTYNGDSPQTIGSAPVTNYDNTSFGTITLEKALAYSVNTVFGQLAVELGAEDLVKTAEQFGFDQAVGQDFDATVSVMPDPVEMTTWETAWAGDGQPVGEHTSPAGPQATVIQMAMVASAIANGGTIMNPYVVQGTLDRSGTVLSATSPRKFATVDSPETNATVTRMMETVVNEGTATETIIGGVKVAGKTGTAQTDKELDDAWFIGFTEVDGARFAIAIVTEQTGSGAATPLARSILQTALATRGVY